ncbi:hypothetical protein JTB14_015428 [Gonioctena quinquepunctata]|nr:hypothetical protein JTB14_015428 [Gonioctena quinquepunctata]
MASPSRGRSRSVNQPKTACHNKTKMGCCALTAAQYCKLAGSVKSVKRRTRHRKSRGSHRRRRSRHSRRGSHRRGSRRRSRRRKSKRRSSRRSGRGHRRHARKSRRRSHGKKHKRCARPGPKTINPFFNYMRIFRKKKEKCGWPVTRVAIEGAKCWCKMNQQDKLRFYREACKMRKHHGKSRRSRSKGRHKRHRSHRRSHGRKRGRSRRSHARRHGRSRKRSRSGKKRAPSRKTKTAGGCL